MICLKCGSELNNNTCSVCGFNILQGDIIALKEVDLVSTVFGTDFDEKDFDDFYDRIAIEDFRFLWNQSEQFSDEDAVECVKFWGKLNGNNKLFLMKTQALNAANGYNYGRALRNWLISNADLTERQKEALRTKNNKQEAEARTAKERAEEDRKKYPNTAEVKRAPSIPSKKSIKVVVITIGVLITLFIVLFSFGEKCLFHKNDGSSESKSQVGKDNVVVSGENISFSEGLKNGEYKQVLVLHDCVVCVTNNGNVITFSGSDTGINLLKGYYLIWKNVDKIYSVKSRGKFEYVYLCALKSDGTILIDSSTTKATVDTSTWPKFTSIDVVAGEIIGLCEDGTLFIYPENPDSNKDEAGDFEQSLSNIGRCSSFVSFWGGERVSGKYLLQDRRYNVFGVTPEGEVVYNYDSSGFPFHSEKGETWREWRNISAIAIAFSEGNLFGLTNDGKVLYAGRLETGTGGLKFSYLDFRENWNEGIVSIAAGDVHFVALKSDGTVHAEGHNYYGQCEVSNWTNIIRIGVYGNTTVAYRENGEILLAGYNPLENQ